MLEAFIRAAHRFDFRSVEALVADNLEVNGDPSRKTILYIAIKYDYADKNRGLSYEHYHLYLTLMNMGYRLIYFPYDQLKQEYGKKKMSSMLREIVYYYHPEILLYYHFSDWVDLSVWQETSNDLPIKTIIMLGDDYLRYEETRPIWNLFNIIVTMDPYCYEKRKKEGFSNVFLSQFGVNHFLYKKLNLKKIYDVVFIGQCYGKRPFLIKELRKKGIHIAVFGKGWPESCRILQSDLIKIYNQGKITFNSYITSQDTVRMNARDFEAAACGSLCVTQDIKEIRECFVPGKEIITYSDIDDAAEKILYYLSHDDERQIIAKEGYARTLSSHTYEQRFKEIFKSAQIINK